MYLETKGLTKVFGDQVAVDKLDMSIDQGSFTAILGPNGAGKSTTISMLLGLLSPTSGKIIYHTKTPKIGVVFQTSVLDAELTVSENLNIRQKMTGKADKSEIDQVMHKLGVSSFANKRYGQLSGGQRRRTDIARALIGDPDILFLDEPTAGLDIQTRKVIWEILTKLRQEEKLTVVLTTHYLEEADQSDMIFIIDQGKLIAHGSATDLKYQYAKNQLILETNNMAVIKEKLTSVQYAVIAKNKLKLMPENTKETLRILREVEPCITHFEYREGTIDDAFIALTGKEMH